MSMLWERMDSVESLVAATGRGEGYMEKKIRLTAMEMRVGGSWKEEEEEEEEEEETGCFHRYVPLEVEVITVLASFSNPNYPVLWKQKSAGTDIVHLLDWYRGIIPNHQVTPPQPAEELTL